MKTKAKSQIPEKPNFWTESEEQAGIARAINRFSLKKPLNDKIKNK